MVANCCSDNKCTGHFCWERPFLLLRYNRFATGPFKYHCELEAMKYWIHKSYSNNSCSSKEIAIINNDIIKRVNRTVAQVRMSDL